MESGTARWVWQFAEPIHAVTYFAPETRAQTDALGLRGGWMSYFGCRAAPLGRVPAAVVTAAFFNFHPEMVSRAVPDVWAHASPADLVDVWLAAAGDALERILGDEVRGPLLRRTAELAGRAADACDTVGRAVAAANGGLGRSDVPHLELWQAVTTLREHRGDGHVAALVGRGIGPCEALALQGATGRSPANELRVHRGWSEAEWSAATARLQERGWLLSDGSVGAAGADARDAIEAETDWLALGPFRALGADAVDELVGGLRPFAAWIMSTGTVPARNLMGVPWPPEMPNRSDGSAQPGRAAPTGLP